jgi:hypothetical protein
MIDFDDYIECQFELLDILLQFSYLVIFIKHLDSHIDWPHRVDLERANSSLAGNDLIAKIEMIECTYKIILPRLQNFTYVTQYIAILEWSLKKILEYHQIKYQKAIKQTQNKNRSKIETLINIFESKLNIKITNREKIIQLYRLRNKIAHSNCMIPLDNKELSKWTISELYEVVEAEKLGGIDLSISQQSGSYIVVNRDNLIACIQESLNWLKKSTRLKSESHAYN